jgi:hypothetical protein
LSDRAEVVNAYRTTQGPKQQGLNIRTEADLKMLLYSGPSILGHALPASESPCEQQKSNKQGAQTMARKHWFRSWSSNKSRRGGRSGRPRLETLEGRILPATVNWINPGSGNWDTAANWSTGSVPGAGADAVINTASPATITLQSQYLYQVHSLTTASTDTLSLNGGTLIVDGSSTLSGGLSITSPQVLQSGGGLFVSGQGVTFVVNGSTTLSNGSLFAQSGATVSLPELTTCAPPAGEGVDLAAGGAGSVLSLPNLTTFTGGSTYLGFGGSTISASGTVDMPSLTQISGGPVTLEVAGTGSVLNVPALRSFSGSAGQRLSSLLVNDDQGQDLGGTINDGSLTTLAYVDVVAEGPMSVSQITSVTNSTFSLITGTETLGNLTTIDNSDILVGDFYGPATLNLPAVTSYTCGANSGLLSAFGTGSVLSLPNLTTLIGSSGGSASRLQLDGFAGGTVELPALSSVSNFAGIVAAGNNGSVEVDSTVVSMPSAASGATIDVSQLPALLRGWSIDLDSAGTFAGTTFNVPQGDTVDLTGQLGGNGKEVGTVTFTGVTTFNVAQGAVVDVTGGQTVNYSGTLTGSGGGIVQFSGGFLAIGLGGATLNFAGNMFQWTSGVIDSSLGNLTNLGTLNIATGGGVYFWNDGTLDNFGTILQSGAGPLSLHSDNVSPTTLKIEPGGSYLIEGDAGINNFDGGSTALVNAGTIDKTAGTGNSILLINGTISNTGTVEADSGTLFLNGNSIDQVAGATLTGGTWNAQSGAALEFPTGTKLTANEGNITLGGVGATVIGLAGLASNSGSLTLTGGASFSTAGDFTNSGSLTANADSTLTVTGNFTQTSGGSLNEQIGGTPDSGQFGQVSVSGTATLDGAFNLALASNFNPVAGQQFGAISFIGATGTFSTFSGLSPFFIESLTPTNVELIVAVSAVDLSVTGVTAPATASAGQDITVSWQVANTSGQDATGSWQDRVYLSFAQTISSTSILLGAALHTGGLPANGTYTGNWAGAIPGVLPGSYYIVVQVDSLYQVPDPGRGNNTQAAASQLAISIPTLTIGTPASASFTATESDLYYQLSAAAGSSFLLAMTGSPASETNAIYVSFNSLPTTYHADFQSSLTGPNPTLAVPAALGGNYYILVHHQSGSPGSFTLVASLSGLTLLELSPATVGNAGAATLTVNGLDLGPDTSFTLSGTGGTIAGTTSFDSSSTLADVTFDLLEVAAGAYDLKASNPDGTTVTLSGAVQVTAGGGPDVVATLVGDNPARVGRSGVLYVQYANMGNDDAGAPLITLLSDPGIPIGLDASQPPADAELQVLGINLNGPAGVLPPGATFRFPVYFTVGLSGPFEFGLDLAGASDNQAIDWDAIVPKISADVTGAANWPAVFAQLQQMLGSTWGQYISVLDHDATVLPASVGDASDPIDVLGLAVKEALAAVSTSISGVAVLTAPGVLLAGNTITATNGTTGDVFTTNILNDGSFAFPTVTAGSYTFSVPGDLIHGSPPPVTVNAGQAVTGVTVTLDPEVTLSGQVTGGGFPVAGADVSVWSATGVVTDVQTNASGNYAASFPPGTYTLIVSAPGLARSYSSVTLAAGPQGLHVALAAESAVSGMVSLSDGQAIKSIDVLGVLHGNQPLPYFSATFTRADFLFDSLAAGVYDFCISAPGYNPVSIPNVQIGQGQTVNLGAVQLAPVDPVASAIDVGLRNTWFYAIASTFLNEFHCGSDAARIISEYFTGPGVASPFRVLGMVTDSNYLPGSNYSYSTVPNDHVTIQDQTDVKSFRDNSSTKDALETTLLLIDIGLEDLPEVQSWLRPFKNNGTIPPPLDMDVPTVMDELSLSQWQDVEEGSPAADFWHFQGLRPQDAIANFLAGGVGSGGSPPPVAVDAPDNRIITGSLKLEVSCDGTVTVTPDFHVAVNDTFDFAPASLIAGIFSLGTLAHLEGLDMTADVNFDVEFDGLKIDPAHFWVQPPDIKPCVSTDCIPADTISCNPVTPVRANDPNALFGPAGYGPQGLIQSTATVPYTVDFENDGSTAALDVTVTEQLDLSLEWSTFQLGSFGWGPVNVSIPAGLTQYQTTVSYQNSDGTPVNVQATLDFNVQTGLLTVDLVSLDPLTGQAPIGVFDGFLYSENGTGDGSGYVGYTIQPKAGLFTGTVVNQQASVVFDTNSPLATNVASNTIANVVNQTSLSEPAGTTTPAAAKISTLLGTHYSDPDGSKHTHPGIAVIATAGEGAWQYSTNGKTWTNIATVSSTSALLLPQADQLRFLPAGLGTDPAKLFYVAWDGSTDAAGQHANAGTTGGGSSFSANSGELDVTLNAVTQAPVWLASSTTLTPVLGGDTNPGGQTVQQAFGDLFSGDKNQSAGIAVAGMTATAQQGTWQYQLVSGGGWQNFPRVSASAALMLGPNDLVRFVPKTGLTGLVTLLVHAWDGSGSFTAGGTANLSKSTSSGGTTPFSSAVLTGKLYVNHAPTQNAVAVSLPSSPENTSSKTVSVATLLKDAKAADVDRGAMLGLALTGVAGPGTWQYELSGNVWQNVPASLSEASALLLPSTALLRFDPTVNQSGTATLSWDAWDGTQGTAGQGFAIAGTGGATAVSKTSATATLTVTPSKHPPAWSGSGAALTPVRPGNSNPAGDTVGSIFGSYFEDTSATVGIAVSGVSGTKNGQWQYSTDGGTHWTNLPSVSASQALLLSMTDLLRFKPKPAFLGTVSLTAYAWDGAGTGNSAGKTVHVHGNDFSSTTLTATCLVNSAPTLSD